MKALLRRKGLAPAVLVVAAGGTMPVHAESQTADESARPGSFQAVMSTKSPGVFGSHLPAADQAPAGAGTAARPGSFAAIMSAKSPGTFGPRTTAAPSERVAASGTCRAGSFAAISAAKLPPNARPGDPAMYRDCR